jgi:ABC-type bacteriocin/lantibiotic exporter with double-glycine peptidase domain
LAGFPPEQARHFLSYLPQFVRLFDRSILENLRLLSGAASRERLMVAAGHSGLDELVQTLPMGYETLVNAGGATFSGGQRQLIALTAVLASSKSVLVLDEAMANIDPIWKARLLRSPLFLDRTVIFASHDEDQSRDGPTFAGARQITIGSERHEPFH